MAARRRRAHISYVFLVVSVIVAVSLGMGVGLAIAATKNIQNLENFGNYRPSLPTQILDINGELIAELFNEKREIITIDAIPECLINALLTREDRNFFQHPGFSLMGTFRALWNKYVLKSYHSGGSTITQQLAGWLYSDRTEITYRRKFEELWWALQMERRFTKKEILEQYLNEMYFGHNTYGVEAASQFYFEHSARDVTLAESAMLVIQLNAPGYYSPINNPNTARKMQEEILRQMIELGYATKEEVDLSLQKYWDSYDFTRPSVTTAWLDREDKAPYFTEYVRQQLEDMLVGSVDIYNDGLIVHTTLNLEHQRIADEVMARGIRETNEKYQSQTTTRLEFVDDTFLEIVDVLSLNFDIEDIRVAGSAQIRGSEQYYLTELNPVVDIISSLFTSEPLRYAARVGYQNAVKRSDKS